MSGGHDKSILGVSYGDYDMAAVADDVFERMVGRGTIKREDFRVLYTSDVFPTNGYVHAHDLKPAVSAKIRECFFNYAFSEAEKKEFNGEDRYVPIAYRQQWAVVREVAEKSGTPFNKRNWEAESKRETDALARRQQQQQQAPAAAKP
jgi:phosphonate transport system substrate-binding protein